MELLWVIAGATTFIAIFFFVKWQQAERQGKDARTEAAIHKEKLIALESDQRQEQDLTRMFASIEDRFAVLAQQAIQNQSEQHVQLANTTIGGLLGKLEKDISIFRDQVGGMLQTHRTAQVVFEEKFNSLESTVGSLGQEANNLAAALRGNNKAQGDWGEVVLGRALEAAGLHEGEGYIKQSSYTSNGVTVRPDVVLNLPGDRHVVIDAKVSLVAYIAYCEASEDNARDSALSNLHAAMMRQVNEIHEKYLQIKELNSLGFAIMYTPIEPAWQLMMSKYPELFATARAKNVIVLGPTNLLATLRIVENIWQADRSSRSVQKIVARAGRMHDVAAKLLADIDKAIAQHQTVARTLDGLRTSTQGSRGLIREAQRLEELGAKGRKQLPELDNEVQLIEKEEAVVDKGSE